MKRRDFLKYAGRGAVAAAMTPLGLSFGKAGSDNNGLSIGVHRSRIARASGTEHQAMTKAVVEKLGDMTSFVSKGSKVVIKPNIGWDRPLSFRANTNPDIVQATIEMVLDAGASDVHIVDSPCDGQNPMNCFEVSGIKQGAEMAGVHCYPVFEPEGFVEVEIPGAATLKKAHVIREVLEADVIINIPVAKSHMCTKYTGALKNWMGIVSDRRFFHHNFVTSPRYSPEHWRHIARCIADIQSRVKPTLNILDATWIMTTNGPAGPGQLVQKNQIIASTDPVAIDAYAVGLFENIAHADVWSIEEAARLGLGEMDLSNVSIEDVA